MRDIEFGALVDKRMTCAERLIVLYLEHILWRNRRGNIDIAKMAENLGFGYVYTYRLLKRLHDKKFINVSWEMKGKIKQIQLPKP